MWIFRGEKPTQEALTPVGMKLEQRPLGVSYNTNKRLFPPSIDVCIAPSFSSALYKSPVRKLGRYFWPHFPEGETEARLGKAVCLLDLW